MSNQIVIFENDPQAAELLAKLLVEHFPGMVKAETSDNLACDGVIYTARAGAFTYVQVTNVSSTLLAGLRLFSRGFQAGLAKAADVQFR